MTEAKFKPETDVVIIKPIMRARNPLVNDPDHEAFFLFGNAKIDYKLPIDRYGNLLNPFKNEEEQRWLESELDLDLNYHKIKDNAWHKIKVSLGKDARRLDLRNAKQYLEYVVLRANSLHIAPSAEEAGNKRTYRYMITSVDQEVKDQSNVGNLKIEAYIAFGKLRDSKEDMINFLKVYGKKVSDVSKETFLTAEITKIVENDTETFLSIISDKDNYEMKLLIAEAVEAGAVIKKSREYLLPGGDALAETGQIATIDNAVKYLKSPKNQDILTLIQTRVKTSKSK